MSISEALSRGLQVTGVGLIIVFSVLVILMLVMMAMKAIFYRPAQKDSTDAPIVADTAAPADTDDGVLIAVLTAAVAASMNTSAGRLKIKSYRRVENNAPAWKKAGINDVIDSRF